MAARNCKDDDIEDILRRLEAGELSEDECESDGDDLDFYPSREDLLQVLEDEPTDDVNNSDSPNSNNNSTSNDNQSTVSGSNQHIPASTPISNRQLIWKKQSFQFDENKILFDGNTAYPSEVTSLETPYQFFSYFFTDQIFEHIVQESNRYSIQKNPARPESITTTELRQYLGILTFMSVFRYPNIRSYWSTKFGFAPISETMSLNRFEKIRSFIHFNDNDKHLPTSHINHDRLHKLRPIIDHK